ncbi:MAG: hypothetical protein ACTHL5_10705 [Rhodanobacter sp.]
MGPIRFGGAAPFFWGLCVTMWLPSRELLNAATEQQRQSIFIAQIWHELLSASSPDTYRARALDVRLLLEELRRVASYAQHEAKWISHVHAICEEIADQDSLATELFKVPPVAQSALLQVSRFRGAVGEIPRLLEQANLYLDLTHDYLSMLAAETMHLAPDKGKKKLLASSLKALATHVQALELSDESIEKLDDGLCNLPPEEVVATLCGVLHSGSNAYSCFVAIDAPRPLASSLFSQDNFRECGAPRFAASATGRQWYATQPKGIVVEISVNSRSRRRAAEQALGDVLTLVHLHALYANGANVSVVPQILIQQGNDYRVVEVTPSHHFGLEPRRNSTQLATMRFKRLSTKLRGRISNFLESHALAVASTDARSAVIHLWTALETLASGLGSEGIGPRVANAVAPIVAWRRIDKIVTYLAISSNEYATHAKVDIDRTHLPRSNGKHFDRSDMLACLTGPDRNPGILNLFSSCGGSPLLAHRIYRAWQELSESKEVRAALERSRNRVRWQTLRFYRARNLLIHYGELDTLALRLLENAQYYLSTCVGRVLHDLCTQATWDVQTSLEFHRQRFESLLDRLRVCPEEVGMGEVLVHTSPEISGISLWGPKARFGAHQADVNEEAPAPA